VYLGVLVTMSVEKDHSEKYIGQLNDMIANIFGAEGSLAANAHINLGHAIGIAS
jgi:hypothetical protein